MLRTNKPLDALLAEGADIDRALRHGVREALLKHQKLGQVVAVWRDGKVVVVPPEEILRDPDDGNGDESGASK